MDKIAQALAGAADYLTTHPQEARYTDSLATATVVAGLRVDVRGPNGEALTTDMVASVGGDGSAPSPGWFLRAAEASCVATLVVMRAAQLDLDPGRVAVDVDSVSDDRGILGLAEGVMAGPLSTRVHVTFAGSPASRAELEALADWAVDHCPVTDAVRRAVPMATEVSLEA